MSITGKEEKTSTDLFDPEEIEELLREYAKPVPVPKASGSWITAQLARDYVCKTLKVDNVLAASAICRRALYSFRVECETFSRGEDPHEGIPRIEYFKDKKTDLSHFTDKPSRQSFGEARGFFDILGSAGKMHEHPDVKLCSWETGDFSISIEQDFSYVHLNIVGLRFDAVGLRASFEGSVADVRDTKEPSKTKKRKGGRPASDHGTPIANITLQLSNLSSAELSKFTAASLSIDLADAYSEAGFTPPHSENLERTAMGILRVLRHTKKTI